MALCGHGQQLVHLPDFLCYRSPADVDAGGQRVGDAAGAATAPAWGEECSRHGGRTQLAPRMKSERRSVLAASS